MKLITWNCNGAFRNKFKFIKEFDADIYVIQECENPELISNSEYKEFASNHVWIGDNKNKGLGVFAKSSIKINNLNWSSTYQDHTVKYFLPILINNSQKLVAVWAHHNNSPTFGYIGQVWKYFQVNAGNIADSIIIGDFNSNRIWDKWDRWWNHSDVITSFEEMGLTSVYHMLKNEEQGKESLKTFFLQRNYNKGYHIDYCFMPKNLISDKTSLDIPSFEIVKHLSDHIPLIITF